MYVDYELKSGTKIQAFLRNDLIIKDFYKEDTLYTKDRIYAYEDMGLSLKYNHKSGKTIDIYRDNEHFFFVYNGEEVNILDFKYYNVKQLIEHINDNNSNLTSDMLLATFLKDKNIVANVDINIPNSDMAKRLLMLLDYKSDKLTDVLFAPDFDSFRSLNWNERVELEPLSEEYKIIFGRRNFSIQDIFWGIKSGNIRIVDRNNLTVKEKTLKIIR